MYAVSKTPGKTEKLHPWKKYEEPIERRLA
jgi:hypothetical protein